MTAEFGIFPYIIFPCIFHIFLINVVISFIFIGILLQKPGGIISLLDEAWYDSLCT